MKKLNVAVLGATGYGGGEVLRLLHRDANFEVVFATSRTKAGTPVSAVHRNLEGLSPLKFSDPSVDEIVGGVDFVIGALPHGASAETLAPLVDRGCRVIDLSGDFRLRDKDEYAQWYLHTHVRPDLLAKAVYGCTELNAGKIRNAQLVASPGCFATAINLSLLPAAAKGLLKGTPVVVALTGSSGSGAEAKEGTHHPTRAETLRPYKVLNHQHTPEILQTVRDAGGSIDGISFVPVSAPIVRGIFATVAVDLSGPLDTKGAIVLYQSYYEATGRPFVRVLTTREPECATVARTNFVELRPRVGKDGRLYVITAIDNLVKGAAGQAVESLYLMAGLDAQLPNSGLLCPGMWP